jgi:hypothetical protein
MERAMKCRVGDSLWGVPTYPGAWTANLQLPCRSGLVWKSYFRLFLTAFFGEGKVLVSIFRKAALWALDKVLTNCLITASSLLLPDLPGLDAFFKAAAIKLSALFGGSSTKDSFFTAVPVGFFTVSSGLFRDDFRVLCTGEFLSPMKSSSILSTLSGAEDSTNFRSSSLTSRSRSTVIASSPPGLPFRWRGASRRISSLGRVPAVGCVLGNFGILNEAAVGAVASSPASGALPAGEACATGGSAVVPSAIAVSGVRLAISSGIGASMMFCVCMIRIGSRALPFEIVDDLA